MKRAFSFLLSIIVLCFFAFYVYSAVGVGVGTGKIVLDEVLKPGLTYTLPPITVYNTGDETSEYFISTEFSAKEKKLKPENKWFTFSPSLFSLEPGESQVIKVELKIPLKGSVPGEYFSYLIAQPQKEINGSGTSVAVAAASKLYFTIGAANMFQAIYYVIIDFLVKNKPWSIVIPVLVFLFILWRILKKNFKIEKIKN